MFLYLLVIINMQGGTPALVYMENETICEAAAEQVKGISVRASCLYTGMVDQ